MSALDLMDWKTIERNATATINDHKIGIVISEVLLREAVINIKKLHGKTLQEEEKDLKNASS